MSTASLLQKLGVYVAENFMSASECANLCLEMRAAAKTEAATYSQADKTESINHSIRRTRYCAVSDESKKATYNQIESIKSKLEDFFETSLSDDFEQPKFLHYGAGDFFSPHTDEQLNRRINITINLNDKQALDKHSGYAGGALQLYGLMKQGGFSNRGIAAPSTAGCLIAYPVDLVHEVTPISAGARLCIVSRYLAKLQN